MTVTASATGNVEAAPREILEFVLDLERYKTVDPKIVRVLSVVGPDEQGQGSIKFWGKMRGLPPAPDKQDFLLERWHRLTFTGASRQPARAIFDFVGTVECQPAENGSTVTHAYEFRFKGPFRPIERFLHTWLQTQIEQEVQDISEQFRSDSGS